MSSSTVTSRGSKTAPAGQSKAAVSRMRVSGIELLIGQRVELVRYRPTDSGWTADLVSGQFAGRDDTSGLVRLVTGDRVTCYDDTLWQVCTR